MSISTARSRKTSEQWTDVFSSPKKRPKSTAVSRQTQTPDHRAFQIFVSKRLEFSATWRLPVCTSFRNHRLDLQ